MESLHVCGKDIDIYNLDSSDWFVLVSRLCLSFAKGSQVLVFRSANKSESAALVSVLLNFV